MIQVAAVTLILALPAHAAAGNGPKARIFAKYDTNKNGVIDGDEIGAVRAAYAAEPKGEFARYDTNKDGQLSDAEIAEIKPPGGKKPAAGDKRGQHRNGDAKKPESQPDGK